MDSIKAENSSSLIASQTSNITQSLFHSVDIGSVKISGNLFLAPVAGYSDAAFRGICRRCGASLCYTEMVSSEALTRGSDKTQDIMLRAPNEDIYAVQLFGGVPETMAEAAKIVIEKANPEIIDINAGCPVPKILKSGAGSTLTKDPALLYKITKATVEAAGSVPVTVKIRSGWDNNNITFREAAKAAYEAGAAAITLHGRTRAQGYEGKANWGYLKELVELLAGKIPVFGSGDAFSPEDAKRMLEETGCQGVMFARGAMGNPFIFKQTKELLTTGQYSEIPIQEKLDTGMAELNHLIDLKGEYVACKEMRKRFCCYSKGVSGGGAVRKAIVEANTYQDYLNVYNSICSK